MKALKKKSRTKNEYQHKKPKMSDDSGCAQDLSEKKKMLVMASLNRESLFKRNVCSFGPTTMRSTMCYCMAALAQPRQGDVVLDPMCGGGSIPLEAALAFPGCLFIGADIHPKAIERCLQNVQHCEAELMQSGSELSFVACDAVNLPFSESSIDSIVTDLP
ncbi:hypothetical protein OSTOST_03301 [Ostertagia ostertagi]